MCSFATGGREVAAGARRFTVGNMKSKALWLASASLLLVDAGSVAASQLPGWYVGLEGGISVVDDVGAFRSHTVGLPSTATSNVAVTFDSGWALLATVGHSWDSGLRLEGELGYRSNKHAIPTSSRTGDFDEFSLMANIAWDCRLSPKFTLTLGAGAGYDNVMFSDGHVDDSDWRLAYQGIAGLRYALAKRTDFALTYRYLRVDGPSFSGTHSTHIDLYTFDDVSKHTLTLGFIFALAGEAAPPLPTPPLPPVVTPPQNFVLHFKKKCVLTHEADLTLTDAASEARRAGPVRVRLEGDAQTDDALDCRLNAAKKNLNDKGVPLSALSSAGDELVIQAW